MRWMKTILAEIVGLFVDDGRFALAILVWLAAVWLILPHLAVAAGWRGLILFLGLAAILLDGAVRRAGR